MESEAKKTVGYYLMLRAVSGFGMSFIAATYVIFLISKGLNLFQVNLVNFFFFGTLFIFEIPTGAFADVFGRRLSFILSCFLLSLSLFVYAIATSFWWFVLGEVIGAVGATFASGAFQAWLVDRLRHQGYEGSIGHVFAREQQIQSGCAIVAAMLGTFAAGKNMSLPWILGGGIMFCAGTLAIIFMREEKFERRRFSFRIGVSSMAETVRTSMQYAKKNSAVRFVIIMGLAQYFSVQAPNMQWQPFFAKFLPDNSALGFVFCGISVAMIIGSSFAPWFSRKIKNERMALSISQIAIGTGICLTVFCSKLFPAMGIFFAHEIARGVFNPLKNVYLNDNIPSRERATLISFESISHHVGGMIGLLVSGSVAQYVSMDSAWVFSGTILILSALVFIKNGKK